MAAEREMADERGSTARILTVGIVGGMVAGMMMAMVEMIYGWLSDEHTLWDAPMAIWAWVFGLDHFGDPANHVWPIVLGMGGHMMNSAMIGVVFAALAFTIRPRNVVVAVMLGVAYGLAIWVVMRYVVLPLNDPESTLFTTDRVSPQWVWWLSHAALGMTAGLVYRAAARARPRERRRQVELRGAA